MRAQGLAVCWHQITPPHVAVISGFLKTLQPPSLALCPPPREESMQERVVLCNAFEGTRRWSVKSSLAFVLDIFVVRR